MQTPQAETSSERPYSELQSFGRLLHRTLMTWYARRLLRRGVRMIDRAAAIAPWLLPENDSVRGRL